jgi:hypothetical protein
LGARIVRDVVAQLAQDRASRNERRFDFVCASVGHAHANAPSIALEHQHASLEPSAIR